MFLAAVCVKSTIARWRTSTGVSSACLNTFVVQKVEPSVQLGRLGPDSETCAAVHSIGHVVRPESYWCVR